MSKEYDTKEIMKEIKEKIIDDIGKDEKLSPEVKRKKISGIYQVIETISSLWDISNDYKINSHRKIIGRFLVKGREVINGEVKRYVDPIVDKQIQYNQATSFIIDELIKNSDSYSERKKVINKEPTRKIDDIIDYFAFEERFRGSREELLSRQSIYIEYFENSNNIVDIGCGRGEFLELMERKGIKAIGVDSNKDMVAFCRKKGFEVELDDGISFLEKIQDNSLGGIIMSQVIEHLAPQELAKIIALGHQKLSEGGYLIAETINPLSLYALSRNFLADISHNRPIHPETAKFLLESSGFSQVDLRYLSPVPIENSLEEIPEQDEDKSTKVINENFRKLNQIIFGFQDYSVIGKK